MSASVARPPVRLITINGHARSPWLTSRAALDVAGDMLDAATTMQSAASELFNYPADAEKRIAARNAARLYLSLCDELERLSS